MTRLVATPPIHPTESFWGYVLRLSEANGYDTPYWLYAIAGLQQNHMFSTTGDPEALANALGLDGAALKSAAPSPSSGRDIPALRGHVLISRQLRVDKPRLCPDCVQEHGFIGAEMDLSFVTVCPTHRRVLIKSCPECGRRLRWFRPGLLTCTCGANLAGGEPIPTTHEVTEITAFIIAKLHRRPEPELSEVGFDVEALHGISLRTLLSLIYKFAVASGVSAGAAPELMIERGTHILANWPFNFMAMLREKSGDGALRGIGLRKRFQTFYQALFKTGLPEVEIAFVREAFLRFGHEEWGHVDKKLYRGDDRSAEATMVTQGELARRLDVTPAAIRTLRKLKFIPCVESQVGGIARVAFDLRGITIISSDDPDFLTARQAGAWIGLPVPVLNALRAAGIYKTRHLGQRLKAFHRADLRDLILRLQLACQRRQGNPAAPTVSLGDVMRSARMSPRSKAKLIVSILDGEIDALAPASNLRVIEVAQADIERIITNDRAHHNGDRLSCAAAARLIGCCETVIKPLAREGHLQMVNMPTPMVTVESVRHFSKEYVAVMTLARQLQRSPRALAKELSAKGDNLLRIERTRTGKPQTFALRSDHECVSPSTIISTVHLSSSLK